MLNVIMLSVVMLSVVILSIVEPPKIVGLNPAAGIGKGKVVKKASLF